MFLRKNFILANELVQKMGIHIANISVIRNEFEAQGDEYNILKMNNCSFINTSCAKLPNNIRKGIACNTFTDMTDKLPCTWLRTEYDLSERDLIKSGIAIEKITVAGKQFYVFEPEFVQTMRGKIGYVLGKDETFQCLANGDIDGYIPISKKKYFTWYTRD